MSDPGRIYYIVTLQGDHGPFDRGEMKEQLRDGRAQPEDRVRNAFGRHLGTVAELLRERTSGPVAAGSIRPSQPRTRTRLGPMLMLLGAGVLALIAWMAMVPNQPLVPEPTRSSSSPEPVISPPPALAIPAVPVSAGATRMTPPSSSPVPAAASATGLPVGWAVHEIGCKPGPKPDVDSQGWHLSGGGKDIFGVTDQFRFAATASTGDSSITIRVASFAYKDAASKVGLMFRRDSSPDAPFVALCLTGQNAAVHYARSEPGAKPGPMALLRGTSAPRWLRLVRTGQDFNAFLSTDGKTWTALGTPLTVPALSGELLVGIVLASRDDPPMSAVVEPPVLAPARP